MNKVLVIGAHGQIGRRLIPQLVTAGYDVRGMVRESKQQTEIESLGGKAVVGDLEGDFAYALDGCDAVVFTAGSGSRTGGDKTLLVDLWGAIKSIHVAEQKDIQRYVMVSARLADDPDQGPPQRRHYLVAKHLADRELQRSNLPYVILRPGKLTDETGSGRVRTDRPAAEAQTIPREDVAAAVVAALQLPQVDALVTELYRGQLPIPDALRQRLAP